MRAIGVCLIILLCIPTISHSQDYEVSVTNVSVWVRVVDGSGNPVRDMKKDDFEIFEDGKKVSTECFEEVKFATAGMQPTEVYSNQESTKNVAKRFVLFLDLQNTTQVEFERIRPKTDEFLDQLSKANWEVMLVAYLASGKLGVVSPFTRDYVRIGALLDQAKGNAQRDQRISRNENEIMEILSILKVKNDVDNAEAGENTQQESNSPLGSERVSGSGASVDKHFFQMAVTNAYRQAQYFAKQERNDGENSFGALESFGDYYGKRLSDGQHTIILFLSGGISSDPGRRYFDLVNGVVSNQAGNVNPSEFSMTYTASNKEINFDLEKQIQKSVGKLNRYNLTLYAINTRGLGGSGPDVSRIEAAHAALDVNLAKDYQDTLSQIAQETGGLSFQNSQNFKVGFDNILSDLSHQYLLCYRPPNHKKDGKYHSIKVVTKRGGVNLRHRLGYVD